MTNKTIAGHVLVPATEAQDQIATEREWEEWGKPLLTQDQFITREKRVLGPTDFSVTRRQRWALVPADDTTTTDFLSACETYRRPILVKRPGKDEVERALSYSVCSVFVPENKRRNGYAGQMMRLLQHSLSPQDDVPALLDQQEQASIEASGALVVPLHEEGGEFKDGGKYGGNATCSFLYSDVGDFYSQAGWTVLGNRHVEWKPLSSQDRPDPLPDGAKWLQPEELSEVGRIDRQYLLSQLQNTSSDSTAIRFCVDDPEATSWRWLIKRSYFYATTLLPESAPKPTFFGLKLSSSSGKEADASYAVWMFDFIERKVAFLRLRYTSPSAFAQLVGAVRQQAAEFGMKKVVAWNVDLASLEAKLTDKDESKLKEGERVDSFEKELQGGVVVERKGSSASLPALAWYGDKKKGEKIEWVCNEYGWWC
ncbi:hypothetical protein PSEUBRA_001655 [Kalmanozyma brasiliensis GHG001]|uniref:LYC1 C-terminal domain-containing protein n=1 Tax=Kalmanozyma brasiliensis (strain GHG001) TaxID=1365824 RepID=V5ETK6_KALBG|nr:uncharacterized protein PSEUBRA_001655 [Kalmanozyma brasiliensis GHG001]EST08585.1 hypothetical protein PSEUBRA_001655 [Kalmanozyma brasiliensis GHG001]